MPDRPPHRSPSTDVVVRVGAGMVAVGCLATAATLAPLVWDADPLPVAFYLLCFLAPLGLALILVGLWRAARGRSKRLRAASDDARGTHAE